MKTTGATDISAEAIARRAYEIWRADGQPLGKELAHWLRAEKEVRGSVRGDGEASRDASNEAGEQAPRRTKPNRQGRRAMAGSSSRKSVEWGPW